MNNVYIFCCAGQVRLRRELRQSQMEIEILKKAAAYFAKELR